MAAASPPASSSPPPPSAADGDGDRVGCGAARCSSPTPAQRRRTSPNRSGGSARKNPGSRDFGGGSVLKSVNKSTLHFKKSRNRRSGSPNNWTPRKKTESYMKRKIKHLQEADGMTASLHETLGNANPHYTRMAREKIAAREAARKATDARKAAMVEASWCRILRAARIQNKNADEVMEKAMLHAAEAFEEARAMGVMMYDRPDCPHQQYEVESSSHTGAQSTHKVTASFQTAFQVDMEVSAAVKKAFVQLANSPDSAKREEFKELLWKISQNPDLTETGENSKDKQQLVDCSNEDTSVLKLNKENISSSCVSSDFNTTKVQESIDVVNIMLERLKALHEEELASLAVIVATSGLNAALQNERSKYHETGAENNIGAGSLRSQARRYSTAASFIGVQGPKKEVTSELPSLDKFLVKHLSKLEREVQAAREASRKSTSVKSATQGAHSQFTGSNAKAPESTSDLSSILVKHVSKLEKEILEAKKINQRIRQVEGSCEDVKSNDKQLEFNKIQPEAENNCDLKGSCESKGYCKDRNHIKDNYDCVQEYKENKNWYSRQLPPSGAKDKQGGKRLTRVEAARLEALKSFCTIDGNTLDAGLDKIFIKPIHRLEKEKREAREGQINVQKHPQKLGQSATVTEGLDDILVKHVSRLEREKIDYQKKEDALGEGWTNVQKHPQKLGQSTTVTEGLDDILVKHVSRLEREKIDYQKRNALGEGWTNVPHDQRTNDNNGKSSDSLDQVLVKHVSRLEREKLEYEKRNALEGGTSVQDNREIHCSNAAASGSLDQILVKHVSRLEKEKIEHEKDGGMILLKKSQTQCTNEAAGSLADIFVKRPTKLEQAKLASAAEEKPASGLNPVEERRRARQKELLDAWGGMGLGNSMKPHVSKIERDKAAWRIAEDEQKQMTAAREP
ncbi:spindle pole body component 110-like [Miscanthus floridulus]|uniref:spindle pole body component 110-like n=1 Tax=Miscanthus floridulus TaxID=154761 RepID=UPI0034579920